MVGLFQDVIIIKYRDETGKLFKVNFKETMVVDVYGQVSVQLIFGLEDPLLLVPLSGQHNKLYIAWRRCPDFVKLSVVFN